MAPPVTPVGVRVTVGTVPVNARVTVPLALATAVAPVVPAGSTPAPFRAVWMAVAKALPVKLALMELVGLLPPADRVNVPAVMVPLMAKVGAPEPLRTTGLLMFCPDARIARLAPLATTVA